jgi:hypothetical protein
MVVLSIGKVYILLIIICSHLSLLSCRNSTYVCPEVPTGFFDPLTLLAPRSAIHQLASEAFKWSHSGLTEFLAFSGVLFTISENLVFLYYCTMAPFWVARNLINKTISASVVGAAVVFIYLSYADTMPVAAG